MKKSLSLYVVLFGLCAMANSLHADERMNLLQFTCRPEYDFFSVRTMRMDFPIGYQKTKEKKIKLVKSDPKDMKVQQQAESQGFYTVNSVMKNPYKCQLSDRKISVEILNYKNSKGYDDRSGCPLSPNFDVQVSVDGESTYIFSAFGKEPCLASENHEVLIRGEEIRECKLANPFSSIQGMNCSKPILPEKLKVRD